MSDARAEYESAIDRAISDCDATVTQAYQHMRSYCDQAWYTYCVRTGMVTVPRPETEGQDDDSEREAVARPDGQHGDGNGESPAESDDSASPGQGTQEGTDNRAADAESSPDSR